MESFRVYELTLTGPARERGLIHGESLRPQIQDAVAEHSESVEKTTGLDPHIVSRRIVHDTGFLAAARRWTPDVVEEVVGIAVGAGMHFDTIFAWQLIQEMAWFPREPATLAAEVLLCTSLGSCPPEGSTIIAQTADGPGWGSGLQTLIHLEDPHTGIRTHLLGWPGLVGVYGLNDQGIGICCNSMFLDVSHSATGLGALFTVRKVLAQSIFQDVDRIIRAVPHASGTNFMVGAPGHAVSYEVSATTVETYAPSSERPITYHTNHALAHRDRVPVEAVGWDANSRARFAAVQRRMQGAPQPLTWETARTIISTHDDREHPICVHYHGDEAAMSLFGIVMECSAEPVLHVSSGPPCCTEFRAFGFD